MTAPPDDVALDPPAVPIRNLDANLAIVARIAEVARRKGRADGAPRVCMDARARRRDHADPGTRSTAHVDDNLAAVDVEVSADDLSPLDVAAPPGAAAGERYPPTSWPGWIGEMRGRRSRWML